MKYIFVSLFLVDVSVVISQGSADQSESANVGDVPPAQKGGVESVLDIHNFEHIMEHLYKVVGKKEKEQMTDEELQFHYFKLHDYDDNNKMDGLEMTQAFIHRNLHKDPPVYMVYSDATFGSLFDGVLAESDLNDDGYVDYTEYRIILDKSLSKGDHLRDGI